MNKHKHRFASIAESEVPPKSFEVGLENIVINEEQILGGRTKSKARFTMEEDTLLIQSWLNVSKDAIVGIDQKAESFWRRVRHNYNEYCGEHQERGPIALKSRWQKLNAAVQKFVGCYKQAIGAKKSGTTENDVINHALAIFSQDEGEAFKFEYAWRLLKDIPNGIQIHTKDIQKELRSLLQESILHHLHRKFQIG
ncbi:putative glutathione S-transferase [Sesbania bispinosa]|nr:putative glutathione S-transferase [Sesbania bispinosa]